MNSVLRPLRLGEILDQTGQLYRRNFLIFAGVAMIPTAVMFGVYLILFAVAGVPIFMRGAAAHTHPAAGGLFLALTLIATPILLVPMVFSQAGVTLAAVSAFRGTKLKIREVFSQVRPRFWRYLGLMVLQGLVIVGAPALGAGLVVGALVLFGAKSGAGGLGILMGALAVCAVLAAVVFVIILATQYGMGLAACVVEDKTAWKALARASKLSKGTRGRIFVMFLVVWCMMIVLSMIGYIPSIILFAVIAAIGHGARFAATAMVIVEVFNLLINFSLQTLASPAYLVALLMFYFDQRVRLEGYDIEWMMQQAGLCAPAVEPAPNAIAGLPLGEAGRVPAQEQ
jgi:hypothetical protein